MILRNLLYAYAVMPVGGLSGAAVILLVSLWACLRSERG